MLAEEPISLPHISSVLPKGTSFLKHDTSHLSVLSYNILAPVYVRPLDKRTGKVQEFAAFAWAGEIHIVKDNIIYIYIEYDNIKHIYIYI